MTYIPWYGLQHSGAQDLPFFGIAYRISRHFLDFLCGISE